MTAPSTPHQGLRLYRVFLAFVALVILGLNIPFIVWSEQGRKDWINVRSQNNWGADPYKGYASAYSSLLVPEIAMLVMFLLLLAGRPRFNNQKLHTVFRVLFSLTIAFCLVYWPARMVDDQVRTTDEDGYWADSTWLKKVYFCSSDLYTSDSVHTCRIKVSRDMLSFVAGFLVVVELFFAGFVGEIGMHGSSK